MTRGDFFKGITNNSVPIDSFNREKKNSNNSTLDNSSIFNKNITPKFGQLMEKSSELFDGFNKDFQIKRDERIRKEMESRVQNPSIEDEIIDTICSVGKKITTGVKSIFSNK